MVADEIVARALRCERQSVEPPSSMIEKMESGVRKAIVVCFSASMSAIGFVQP
jgi:hypothetical protein